MSGHEDRKAYSRGLCTSCYHAARNLVVSGRATWDSLIKAGVAKPTGAGTLEDRILQKLNGFQGSAVDCQKFRIGSEVSVIGRSGYWRIAGYDRVHGYRLEGVFNPSLLIENVEEADMAMKLGA